MRDHSCLRLKHHRTNLKTHWYRTFLEWRRHRGLVPKCPPTLWCEVAVWNWSTMHCNLVQRQYKDISDFQMPWWPWRPTQTQKKTFVVRLWETLWRHKQCVSSQNETQSLSRTLHTRYLKPEWYRRGVFECETSRLVGTTSEPQRRLEFQAWIPRNLIRPTPPCASSSF